MSALTRLAIVLFLLAASVACGSRGVVDGKLVAADGGTGAACTVELHYEVGDPGTGLRCREPGVPGPGSDAPVVRVGQAFECVTVANAGAVDVTAQCEGYEPYRSGPLKWSLVSFGDQVRHLGDIVLTRRER